MDDHSAIPAGWKLVPIELTRAMLVASFIKSDAHPLPWEDEIRLAWAAMVAASPTATPGSMKAWSGGDGAPTDWDGGPVVREDGVLEDARDITQQQWRRPVPGCKWNIIAYPSTWPKSDADDAQGMSAGTAETGTGSGLQPASPVPQECAQGGPDASGN